MLIDLPNDFYTVKFVRKNDYNSTLLNSPWMIGDRYLHIQRWRPNFIVEMAKIKLLPVWVRFSVLPVEYYIVQWLQRVGNKIGRTLKVDDTTSITFYGKFS